MKSYGRAPTFLMLTGYEQVRSVVAGLAGDWEAARRVELELPETGVCSLRPEQPKGVPSCGALRLLRNPHAVTLRRPLLHLRLLNHVAVTLRVAHKNSLPRLAPLTCH